MKQQRTYVGFYAKNRPGCEWPCLDNGIIWETDLGFTAKGHLVPLKDLVTLLQAEDYTVHISEIYIYAKLTALFKIVEGEAEDESATAAL